MGDLLVPEGLERDLRQALQSYLVAVVRIPARYDQTGRPEGAADPLS